jgi:hypothetical protein
MFLNLADMVPLSSYGRDFLTCRKLLHGADGFTSPPKQVVLRIFIALGRVWTREPWVQWQAR